MGHTGSRDYSGALTAAGMYQETQEDIPAMKAFKNWLVGSTGPKTFAEDMKRIMGDKLAAVGEEAGEGV